MALEETYKGLKIPSFETSGANKTLVDNTKYIADNLESISSAIDSISDNSADIINNSTNISILEEPGISITKFGAVPTSHSATTGTDITDAILQYVEDNYYNGTFRTLIIPPGRWHASTNDIFSLLAARNPALTADQVWDMTTMFRIRGDYGHQNPAQGKESSGHIHPVEICVNLTNDTDCFIRKHSRSDGKEFGNWSIQNITFTHLTGKHGCFLELGDPLAEFSLTDVECHGIDIEGCYFTSPHWRDDYSVDEDGDGICFQTDYIAPLVRITNCYEVFMTETSFRGGPAEQLVLHMCDRPRVHNVRGYIPITFMRVTGNGVPGIFTGCYSEVAVMSAYVADNGQFIAPRSEIGYDNLLPLETSTAPKTMPASISWSIAAGSQYIQFTGLPTTNPKTIGNYIRPYQTIRLTPTTSNQPARTFQILEVDDDNDRVAFGEYDGKCYVPRAISGIGTGVSRNYASNATLIGERISMRDCSFGRNFANNGCPNWTIMPVTHPVHFNLLSASGNTPTGQYGEIISHGHGTVFGMMAKVIKSYNEMPKHPDVMPEHDIPLYNDNYCGASRYTPNYKYFAAPGRCVLSDGGTFSGREYLYRRATATDPHEGEKPWIWRMDDYTTPFASPTTVDNLRLYFPAYAGFDFDMRIYHATGGANIIIYDGNSNQSFGPLTAGWQTVSGTLASNATLFMVNPYYYNPASFNTGLEIAWVGLNP